MAEFCKNHIKAIIGEREKYNSDEEYNKMYSAWYCGDDGLCEDCGYEHIKEDKC